MGGGDFFFKGELKLRIFADPRGKIAEGTCSQSLLSVVEVDVVY